MRSEYLKREKPLVAAALVVLVIFVSMGLLRIYQPDTPTARIILQPFGVYEEADVEDENMGELRVASCPTFWKGLHLIEPMDPTVIKTQSTGESIDLFRSGRADAFISGRALRPDEPDLQGIVLGDGFSFMSREGETIEETEMTDYTFYTDLPVEEIGDGFEGISEENVEEVDDVYEYLDEGIVVTSLENTDYSVAEPVHVLRRDGRRKRLSRKPVLYYDEGSLDDKGVLNEFYNVAGILQEESF